MLFINNFVDSLVIVYLYMFTYNLSFLIIFWALQSVILTNVKTLYSFKDFKLNFFLLSTFLIVLFSIAGVPPFIGFFSKLLILLNLINSNFFLFYFFFFSLLFFGLYFYIQNIKYLMSNNNERSNYTFDLTLRFNYTHVLCSFFVLFFTCFGIFFFDDLMLYFYWVFS